MANGFQGPPAADFYSMLSGLGDTIAKNRADQAKRDAFAQATTPGADGKIDYGRAILGLAQVDPQSAALMSSLQAQQVAGQRDTRDFAFRQAEAERAQRNADRTANRLDEDKYVIKEVEDPNGGPSTFVRIKTTGPEGVVTPGGAAAPSVGAAQPNNPYATGGKTTAEQDKAGGFADRMLASEGILSGVAPTKGQDGPVSPGIQNQGTSYLGASLSKLPTVVGNAMMPQERQKYNQAQLDFVNAQLRKESGAAISQSEFDNAYKQYFPQPGDGPEVIKQKQNERRTAIEAMAREAGRGYRPKYLFNDQGVVEPRAPQVAAPQAIAPQASPTAIPPGAVAALKKDPRLITQFDAKYGKGASKAALGAAPLAADDEE